MHSTDSTLSEHSISNELCRRWHWEPRDFRSSLNSWWKYGTFSGYIETIDSSTKIERQRKKNPSAHIQRSTKAHFIHWLSYYITVMKPLCKLEMHRNTGNPNALIRIGASAIFFSLCSAKRKYGFVYLPSFCFVTKKNDGLILFFVSIRWATKKKATKHARMAAHTKQKTTSR